MTFSGLYTALITPFQNGKIDEDAFCSLIERQIAAGVDGIVPAGTTGESPTLSNQEHIRIIELAVQATAGRVAVIAGTGANSTMEAIHLTQEAERVGATASMQVTPYYNKPSQKGLSLHFSEVAKNTGLPIMLYSVPGRSVIEIDVETAVHLANEHENIVSIKEAGGKTARVLALRAALGSEFSILCGDDPLTLPFLSAGANGLVSVSSNLIPAQMVDMVRSCLSGDLNAARNEFFKLFALTDALMGMAVNPVPIKEALALAGQCSSEFRLPLTNLEDQEIGELRKLLQTHDII